MGKTAYERFLEQQAKNKELANKYVNQYGNEAPGMGDETSGVVIDNPAYSVQKTAELASAQAGLNAAINNLFSSNAQASAAAQAAARALYTGGKYSAPNTLIPGMSYTEWLTKGGMNGQAQKEYDAAVRAAETDYAKTLALYGQNAETLGRAGLTGSGYSDYLTGAGFSAMQGAKVAAADTKALTEAQQRLSYADYLAGVDAQNAQLAAQENAKQEALAAEQEATAASIKSTIDQMVQSGMDDKSIMAYVRQHYGDEFLGYVGDWIGMSHMYMDPLLAKNATEQAAQYKQQIYSMLSSGQSAEAVRANMQYVMGPTGADTSQLDAWIAEAQAAAQLTVDANNANNAAAEEDAALQAYADLISGGLDKNTAIDQLKRKYSESAVNYAMQTYETSQANIKAEAQNTTADQLFKALEVEGITLEQIGNAAAYNNLALAGEITEDQARRLTAEAAKVRYDILKKDFESFENMDAVSAQDEMTNWMNTINSLDARDLEDYQRAQLYGMLGDALLSGNIELKKPVSEMLNDIRALDKGKIGEAAYNGVVDAFMGAADIKVLSSLSPTEYASDKHGLEINLGKNENGEDVIQRIWFNFAFDNGKKSGGADKNGKVVWVDSEVKKAAQALGNGSHGDIKVYQGALYVYTTPTRGKDPTWVKLANVQSSSAGGKENAELLYQLLLDYYAYTEKAGGKYVSGGGNKTGTPSGSGNAVAK